MLFTCTGRYHPVRSLRYPTRIVLETLTCLRPTKLKGRRPKPTPPDYLAVQQNYMLLFEHFFALSSHAILAFSQAALVVGILVVASTGDAKAAARPTAITTETSFFM